MTVFHTNSQIMWFQSTIFDSMAQSYLNIGILSVIFVWHGKLNIRIFEFYRIYNDKLWNQFLNPPVELVSTWCKIALEHYYFVKRHPNFLAHTSKFRKNSFGCYHICVSFMVFVSKWHKKKSSKSRSLSTYLSIYLSISTCNV